MSREYDSKGQLVERRRFDRRAYPRTVCICEYTVPVEETIIKHNDGYLRKVTVVMCPRCMKKKQVGG